MAALDESRSLYDVIFRIKSIGAVIPPPHGTGAGWEVCGVGGAR